MIYSKEASNYNITPIKTSIGTLRYPSGSWVFTVAENWWILNKRNKEIKIRYLL